MLLPILFAAATAVGIAGDVYDVTLTSRGLKKGLAEESNEWLIGTKPSTKALYLRDGLVLAFCLLPTLLCATVFHNIPLAYGGLVSPIIYGIRHVQGGLAWKKLGA